MSDDRTPDSDDDRAFVARMRERIAEAARDDRQVMIDETLRGMRQVSRTRSSRVWRFVATALAAAAVAAVVTWLAVRPPTGDPMAFDGGGSGQPSGPSGGGGGQPSGPSGGGGGQPSGPSGDGGPLPGAEQTVRLDARGRLAESELDGERLTFRGGRLVRIEHRTDGVLHGEVVDLDGAGRVVRIETWSRGKLTGTREGP